jgi:hypothetical protein
VTILVWLRFLILPPAIMLALVWAVLLGRRPRLIMPFVTTIAVFLLCLWVGRVSPLGFMVSFGGYLWFLVLAVVAAVVVRMVWC